jgi:NhaA family Na+:H+ antiporter
MAVFFLLVGLELKREILDGHLSSVDRAVLPAVAALGGMFLPALIYALVNHGDRVAMAGWGIPVATDIAFALAVLSLFGARVPTGLKIFLLALAILDDLGAIVIIAIFYSAQLTPAALLGAAVAVAALVMMNRMGVARLGPYLVVGFLLWLSVLESGVHATLAGSVLGLCIPLRASAHSPSPLERLEEDLRPLANLGILPAFAFANAGVSLEGISLASLVAPVPLGIAAGLFIGKQLGVFGFAWLGVRLGLGRLPAGVGWRELYGVAVLCGIGFTMSLFIAALAFAEQGAAYVTGDRLGILLGSALSAVVGALILRRALPRPALRGCEKIC